MMSGASLSLVSEWASLTATIKHQWNASGRSLKGSTAVRQAYGYTRGTVFQETLGRTACGRIEATWSFQHQCHLNSCCNTVTTPDF